MTETTPDRAAQFLADILSAPEELAAVIAAQEPALAAVPSAVLDRPIWRLFGMGSSGFAARDAAVAWREAGLDAAAEIASAGAAAPPAEDTVAVAISSSGVTREVVAGAARHRAGGSVVLGLTSRPESPLAAGADIVIPLAARHRETSGIASLTYRATVAALLALDGGLAVAAETASPAVALAELLDGRGAWVDAAATLLDTGREIHVVGDGARGGMLDQSALMFREAARISAHGFDTGDWLHVGLYTQLPGDALLLFAGAPADAELVETVHARGGRVLAVGPEAALAGLGADLAVTLPAACADPVIRALVEPAVAELVAAELWRRAGR